MTTNVIRSMENLEKVFRSNCENGKDFWHWSLYDGHHKQNRPASHRIHQNDYSTNVDDSFEALKEQLELRNLNGDWTVYQQKSDKQKTDTTGFPLFVRMGQADYNTSNNTPGASTGIAGIGSINQIIEEKVGNVEKRFQIQRLEEKIEEMEAEMSELRKGKGVNSFLSTLIESNQLAPLINGLGMALIQRMGGPMPAQVSTIGFPPSAPAAPYNQENGSETELELTDRQVAALIKLAAVTSQEELDNILETIATFVAKDKPTAMGYLSMLKQ